MRMKVLGKKQGEMQLILAFIISKVEKSIVRNINLKFIDMALSKYVIIRSIFIKSELLQLGEGKNLYEEKICTNKR